MFVKNAHVACNEIAAMHIFKYEFMCSPITYNLLLWKGLFIIISPGSVVCNTQTYGKEQANLAANITCTQLQKCFLYRKYTTS